MEEGVDVVAACFAYLPPCKPHLVLLPACPLGASSF